MNNLQRGLSKIKLAGEDLRNGIIEYWSSFNNDTGYDLKKTNVYLVKKKRVAF